MLRCDEERTVSIAPIDFFVSLEVTDDAHPPRPLWVDSNFGCCASAAPFAALNGCSTEQRGLLDSTLVVWMGEFGRTPRFNKKAGRDHWPHTGVAALAGGGIKGGQVIGATDDRWTYPVDRPVSPEEIAATIFHAAGVNLFTEYHTPLGRPVPLLARRCSPIRELI